MKMQIPSPADPNASVANQPVPTNPVGPAFPVPNQPVAHQLVQNQSALTAPQIIHQQVLNWSHFKSEFAGRPEENVMHIFFTPMIGW